MNLKENSITENGSGSVLLEKKKMTSTQYQKLINESRQKLIKNFRQMIILTKKGWALLVVRKAGIAGTIFHTKTLEKIDKNP